MRRGFTLIEMMVVLAIIAIVTHLALKSLSGVRDEKLITAANQQLQTVRDCVFAENGDGEATGFLADMGRLVAATNGTLAELWQRPAGARDYAVVPAEKAFFARGVDDDLEQAGVYVATGWRGPYLRLPLGKSRLMDPWGNALESPDDAGFSRIVVSNAYAIGARHFGPTALTNDPRRASVSLLPGQGHTSRLIVKAVSTSGTRVGSVDYKWFGPADGLVTGAVAKAVSYGASHVFSGLTPGKRVIWDSASGIARIVKIHPGDNLIEIQVP